MKNKKIAESIIKDLEQKLQEAENFKSKALDYQYAYRCGVLMGAIQTAIFDLQKIKK